jgi:predicted enzyme related to lactoylglutathione lyase
MSKKSKTASGIVWFEIPADDTGRAKKFYASLFGWNIKRFPGMTAPEAQNYLHIDTGGPDASPDGGIMSRMHPEQGITSYISVPSVTRYMSRVEKLGGSVCKEKTAVPGMGYFAICKDTENNTFAIWEMNPKAR